MCAQSRVFVDENPKAKTVIEVKIVAIDKLRRAKLEVVAVHGDQTTLLPNVTQKGVSWSSTLLKPGMKLDKTLRDQPQFDEDGNPLAIRRFKDQLQENDLKVGSTALYLPSIFVVFPNTKQMLETLLSQK